MTKCEPIAEEHGKVAAGFRFIKAIDNTGLRGTNGPITVWFVVVYSGLTFDADWSNITVDHPALPAIALAAAQWHRRHKSEVPS